MIKIKARETLQSGPKIAQLLDVDPATVRRWRREGCPCQIIGHGLIRYELSKVLEWRANRNAIKSEAGE
jgi:phage terminase Nu1 subunit (DNA packaging protein)